MFFDGDLGRLNAGNGSYKVSQPLPHRRIRDLVVGTHELERLALHHRVPLDLRQLLHVHEHRRGLLLDLRGHLLKEVGNGDIECVRNVD